MGIPIESVADVWALSPPQLAMLYHAVAEPESDAYLEQGVATLVGDLDEEAFDRAWATLLERHDVLRAGFVWTGISHPVQVVRHTASLPIARFDWRGTDADVSLERYLADDRARGFDLSSPPLVRLAVARVADGERVLVLTIHHLVHDAWSTALLLAEFLRLYDSFTRGVTPDLAPAPSYREYVAWCRDAQTSESAAYWRRALAGRSGRVGVAEPRPPAASPSTPGAFGRVERRIDRAATVALERSARERRVTLGTLLLAAWSLVVAGGEAAEATTGVVVSGRPPQLAGSERIVGPFLNTVPHRVWIDKSADLDAWLASIHAARAEAMAHELAPLAAIRRWAGVEPDDPLFDSILVVQNVYVEVEGAGAGGITVTGVRYIGHPDAPLMARVWPESRLRVEGIYDARRYRAETVDLALCAFAAVLDTIALGAATTVGELVDRLAREGLLPSARSSGSHADLGARLRSVVPKPVRQA